MKKFPPFVGLLLTLAFLIGLGFFRAPDAKAAASDRSALLKLTLDAMTGQPLAVEEVLEFDSRKECETYRVLAAKPEPVKDGKAVVYGCTVALGRI